ncbi:unnamed protein product [Amoebophrya sp. A25]|nr:unnamed protein product [Amoebophrya sp. A25]|eukprot:GSA25T00010430001.1
MRKGPFLGVVGAKGGGKKGAFKGQGYAAGGVQTSILVSGQAGYNTSATATLMHVGGDTAAARERTRQLRANHHFSATQSADDGTFLPEAKLIARSISRRTHRVACTGATCLCFLPLLAWVLCLLLLLGVYNGLDDDLAVGAVTVIFVSLVAFLPLLCCGGVPLALLAYAFRRSRHGRGIFAGSDNFWNTGGNVYDSFRKQIAFEAFSNRARWLRLLFFFMALFLLPLVLAYATWLLCFPLANSEKRVLLGVQQWQRSPRYLSSLQCSQLDRVHYARRRLSNYYRPEGSPTRFPKLSDNEDAARANEVRDFFNSYITPGGVDTPVLYTEESLPASQINKLAKVGNDDKTTEQCKPDGDDYEESKCEVCAAYDKISGRRWEWTSQQVAMLEDTPAKGNDAASPVAAGSTTVGHRLGDLYRQPNFPPAATAEERVSFQIKHEDNTAPDLVKGSDSLPAYPMFVRPDYSSLPSTASNQVTLVLRDLKESGRDASYETIAPLQVLSYLPSFSVGVEYLQTSWTNPAREVERLWDFTDERDDKEDGAPFSLDSQFEHASDLRALPAVLYMNVTSGAIDPLRWEEIDRAAHITERMQAQGVTNPVDERNPLVDDRAAAKHWHVPPTVGIEQPKIERMMQMQKLLRTERPPIFSRYNVKRIYQICGENIEGQHAADLGARPTLRAHIPIVEQEFDFPPWFKEATSLAGKYYGFNFVNPQVPCFRVPYPARSTSTTTTTTMEPPTTTTTTSAPSRELKEKISKNMEIRLRGPPEEYGNRAPRREDGAAGAGSVDEMNELLQDRIGGADQGLGNRALSIEDYDPTDIRKDHYWIGNLTTSHLNSYTATAGQGHIADGTAVLSPGQGLTTGGFTLGVQIIQLRRVYGPDHTKNPGQVDNWVNDDPGDYYVRSQRPHESHRKDRVMFDIEATLRIRPQIQGGYLGGGSDWVLMESFAVTQLAVMDHALSPMEQDMKPLLDYVTPAHWFRDTFFGKDDKGAGDPHYPQNFYKTCVAVNRALAYTFAGVFKDKDKGYNQIYPVRLARCNSFWPLGGLSDSQFFYDDETDQIGWWDPWFMDADYRLALLPTQYRSDKFSDVTMKAEEESDVKLEKKFYRTAHDMSVGLMHRKHSQFHNRVLRFNGRARCKREDGKAGCHERTDYLALVMAIIFTIIVAVLVRTIIRILIEISEICTVIQTCETEFMYNRNPHDITNWAPSNLLAAVHGPATLTAQKGKGWSW